MTLGTIFTAVVAFFAPIGTGIWIAVKHRKYTRALLFGVLTFTVFQVLLRIPLLQFVLPNMNWFLIMTAIMPMFTAAFYGITASLFEELGRYLVMKLSLKNHTSFFDGLAFGIGHGGIEAVLLVGVNALILLFYPSSVVSSLSMFAGGMERIFAMTCHIAWSVMVMKSVREKKIAMAVYSAGTACSTGYRRHDRFHLQRFPIGDRNRIGHFRRNHGILYIDRI